MSVKLFNRWESGNIKVLDLGLERYVSLKPMIIPKSGGRNTHIVFHKSKNHIVERLINKLMVPGHKGKKHKFTSGRCTGKGVKVYSIVEKCFDLIEKRTKKNPIEVYVRALENAAPREEITAIEYGGARYPKAVECAPQRRIDVALRMFVQGAYAASTNKKKSIEEALAEEIIKAYGQDQTSAAISKKLELERQADASR